MEERSTTVAASTLAGFTAALASDAPTPGGGSAAAVAASLGASLVAMVARLSQGRPRYAEHAALHADALAAADSARTRFLELAQADAAAYAAYRAARQMAHVTQAEIEARDAASRQAARGAANVPLTIVQECHELLDIIESLAGRSSSSAASDLEVAALLLQCAARGAATNALVNLPAVGDETYAAAVTSEVEERLQRIEGSTARTRELIGPAAQPGSPVR